MSTEQTRYWNDDKESVRHATGFIKDNGDFCYQGQFGLCTRYKKYHFETEREAALDLIKQIDGDIKAFKAQKARITDKYLGESFPAGPEPRIHDPLGLRNCTHPDCGRYDGPRSVECRAMSDNACARLLPPNAKLTGRGPKDLNNEPDL